MKRDELARDALRTLVLVPAMVLIYGFALEWAYSSIIQPAFAYGGSRYVPAGFAHGFIAWTIASVTAMTLPRRLAAASDVVIWVLFVIPVAPSILMSPYLGIVPADEALLLGAGFAAGFVLVRLVARRTRPVSPLAVRVSPTSFWLAIGVFSAIVYVYVGVTAGLSLRFVSIFDVYDVRDDYVEVLSVAGPLGYLVSTQANVINPLILARGLYTKNWVIVGAGIVGQLVLYSGTGFKTILFSVPTVLLVWAIFRVSRQPKGLALVAGATGVVLVAALADFIQTGVLWSSLFARRFLFTPARLSNLYYEYYNTTGFEYLSHSILAPWTTSNHSFGPARAISVWATGSPTTAMNANFLADGFAQFGWFGVLGVAVLLGVYLRVLDRAAAGIPLGAAAIVSVMPAVTLSNTSLQTSMLSHGLVVLLIVLMIVPTTGWPSYARIAPPGTQFDSRRLTGSSALPSEPIARSRGSRRDGRP